jgi:hypothetical protein
MVSDATFELCLPILQDATLEDEDKTDKLEELLKKETTLTGTSLENAILDILWRFKDGHDTPASPPPLRHPVIRRPSPAPWQIPRGSAGTPLSSSPRLGVSPLAASFMPSGLRGKSSAASPFTSPRPSPRLAFSSPAIPHSPSLNAYEFPTDTSPTQEIYGDFGSDNVDWIVNDETASNASSSAGVSSGLNAAAGEWIPPQQTDMSPYDMLRSILGPARSDEEIEAALAMHGYDLSATIMAFMEAQTGDGAAIQGQVADSTKSAILIGKSMAADIPRPVTPAGQQRSGVVCRFFLSTGSCLRADCRFSHDLSNHICKYVIQIPCPPPLTDVIDTGSWVTV